MGVVIVRMLVAYNGSTFRGLAPNPGIRTIVGCIGDVLEPILGMRPDIVMSGRTDAGVHAWGQVLSFDAPAERVDTARLQRSINSRLAPEVVARSIGLVDLESEPNFSARFSATGRRYRYQVLNRGVPDPFLAPIAWWVKKPLDLDAMTDAATYFIGEHDFSSFCRRPRIAAGQPVPSLIRRVTRTQWSVIEPGDVFRFEIDGSAFCHQMVRSIVGWLVAVGLGERQADETPNVLEAKDRSVAEQLAPPHGLTLWQVDY